MEPDTEIVINAFKKHVLEHQNIALTQSQATVLASCLSDQRKTYNDMAMASRYRASTLRDAAAQLFAVVKSAIGRSVNKATCGQAIREWYKREIAFDHNHLFGRENDLKALLNALNVESRRLLCLSGPPSMGKTYLMRRLCQQLQSVAAFEPPIRCHASTSPTVELLYQSALNFLGEPYLPSELPAATRLIHLLETRQLLLVIEKTEALHEPDALGGRFKAESACYEQWLRMLLDRHSLRSCVILVCRVPPQCLQINHDLLLHHPLRSLPEGAAESLLRHHGLNHYPTPQLRQLAQFCGYNPGVLVAAAHKIVNSSDRDLAAFIRDPLAIPYADDQLWQEAWDDLTETERELIGWLLLYPDAAIGLEKQSIGPNSRRSRTWLPVVQSLRNRGFVGVDASGQHFIQTDWLRHIAQQNLSMRLAKAIAETDVQTFGWHPLLIPQAPFWRRRRQWQYVLEPLGDHLEQIDRQSWKIQYRRDKINAMLDRLRAQPDGTYGYGVGNLLNVAVALQVPLSELNLAGLSISHADLWATRLQGIKLAGCQFADTVLPVALHGVLTAALSPDGKTIAVGDEDGRILCWHRTHDGFELYRFAQLTEAAAPYRGTAQLAFGADDMLAIAGGQAVYRWWLGDLQGQPIRLITVSSPVTSLTCCGDEYVAAGLQDSGIVVWYDLLDRQIDLRRHSGRVQEIVANPQQYSDQLVSRGGYGDRMLVWNLQDLDSEPQEIRPEGVLFLGMTWQFDQPVAAAYVGDRYLLRRSDGSTQSLPFKGNISMLQFSASGSYIAALKQETINVMSLATLTSSSQLPITDLLETMAVSDDGRWLLTLGQNRVNHPLTVRVWDTKTQQIYWELTAQPPRTSEAWHQPSLQLQACQGLSALELAYWQSYGAL